MFELGSKTPRDSWLNYSSRWMGVYVSIHFSNVSLARSPLLSLSISLCFSRWVSVRPPPTTFSNGIWMEINFASRKLSFCVNDDDNGEKCMCVCFFMLFTPFSHWILFNGWKKRINTEQRRWRRRSERIKKIKKEKKEKKKSQAKKKILGTKVLTPIDTLQWLTFANAFFVAYALEQFSIKISMGSSSFW